MTNISVCIATYNGAKFIEIQLNSILFQLGQNDEIIIFDDYSIDNTVDLIRKINDKRIKIFQNKTNLGLVKTFENALKMASGNYIFLSDQDDTWYNNKVDCILKIFEKYDIDLIVHNADVFENGNVLSHNLFNILKSRKGVFKNIYSNSYTGCCMAFKKNLLKMILPIPQKKGLYHDVWIGTISELFTNRTLFIDDSLILWNRHGSNSSTLKRRNIYKVLPNKFILITEIIKRFIIFSSNQLLMKKKNLYILLPDEMIFSFSNKNNLNKRFNLFYIYDLKELEVLTYNDLKNSIFCYNNFKISTENIYLKNTIPFLSFSSFVEIYFKRLIIRNFDGNWLTDNDESLFRINKKYLFIKYFFDYIFVILFSPLVLLLISIAAILIKFTSIGPIFFKQTRVGLNGKPFTIYKLRTMIVNNDLSSTVENDKRIYPIGKLLRKTKIDELPQLFNILLGQMSFIGPRPERIEICELNYINPYFNLRHRLKPGITGWAQINNPKATPEDNFEKLEYDLFYIKNLNSFLDFRIILNTFKIIIQNESL